MNTVDEKKAKYTGRAYKQASLARRIQDVIGRPSTRDYHKIVLDGMLKNYPVNQSDLRAAKDIFGPNLGLLKGKTTRQKADHVPSLIADTPYNMTKIYKDMPLCFDIIFVNRIAFMVIVSRQLQVGTTKRLELRNADVVGEAIVRVIVLYRQRGFRIKECYTDGECEATRGNLANAQSALNVASEGKHVSKVKRCIWTVKEQNRATYNILPYKRMPVTMIVEMVHSSNFWLNMFPAHDNVSANYSPCCIMTGQIWNFKLNWCLQFGGVSTSKQVP